MISNFGAFDVNILSKILDFKALKFLKIKFWYQIIKGEKMSNIGFIGVVNIERAGKIYVYQEDKAQKRR